MEFVIGRAFLVGILLVSTTLAIEKWPWPQTSPSESFNKEVINNNVAPGLASHRTRRDGAQCHFTNAPEVVQIYLAESKSFLSPVWLHSEVILIAASDHSAFSRTPNTSPTNLWRLDLASAKNRVNLGFVDKGSLIDHSPAIIDTLTRSPANPSVVTLLSADYKYLFVSLDSGNTWNKQQTPSQHFSTQTMWHSGVDSGRILIKDNNSVLFESGNFGKSWAKIATNVFQVTMGSSALQGVEYLYYSVQNGKYHELWRRDPSTGKTKLLDEHMYLFLVDGKYIFTSKQNFTDQAGTTRRLYVSSNDGDKFILARLPALKWFQSYVLMTTHEVGAFIHINFDNNKGRGDLFASDSAGESYTMSLKNHLYLKHLTGMVHDFYEVQSARGVYITSVREDDGHVTTRISYDRGAKWSYLKPTLCDGKSCGEGNLHLHMNYSKAINLLFGTSYPLPLSRKTAQHIIIAHGVVGHHLSDTTNPTRVFVSDDGGRTWFTSLPPGKYSYAIADYGNLLYAVQRLQNSTAIWVSHDRGKCFQRFPLDTTGVFDLKGLVGDFQLASLVGLAFGVPSNAKNTSEWVVHALKFGRTLERPCSRNDYELVTEKQCLLGYNDVFSMAKPSSICYNEASYNYKKVDVKLCKCSSSDFECDFGYSRGALQDQCKPMGGFSAAQHCLEGQKVYQKSSNGLRLVPGDLCNNTKDFVTFTTAPCLGHDYDSGEGFPEDSNKVVHSRAAVGVVIVGLVAVVTAALCVIGILMYNRRSKSVEPVRYSRYSKLPDDEADEGNPFNDNQDDEMLK